MDYGHLSEGIISRETVSTHNNPSDVFTKFVQIAALGSFFCPKLNLLKDPRLCQVHSYSAGVKQLNNVKHVKEDLSGRAHVILLKRISKSVFNTTARNQQR